MVQQKQQNKIPPAPRATTIHRLFQKRWLPVLFFFCAAMLYFLPYLTFQRAIVGSDDGYRGWHTKGNFGHAHQSFMDKWSPINGGKALMEDRYGRFINPTYLFHLVLPKYQARTVEYLFWTFIAGFFTYLFLRSLAISRGTSLVFGLAFMLAPAFQSYILGGHFARMEVIALMPGIMYFTEKLLQKINVFSCIGLITLIALAYYSEHVQFAYFTNLGMGIYFAARMIYMLVKKQCTIMDGVKRSSAFAASLLFTILLIAMNVFPSLHNTTKVSKRAGGVSYEYASSFALHPEEIVTLLQPEFVGFNRSYWGQNPLKINSEYFGFSILIFAILLFLIRKQGFKQYLFVGFFIVSMLFTLGPHTPVHKLAYLFIPAIKSFRGPSMMYLWFFICAIVLGAMGMDELLALKWQSMREAQKKRLMYGAFTIVGLSLLYMLTTANFMKFWYANILPITMQSQAKSAALDLAVKEAQIGAVIMFLITGIITVLIYLFLNGKLKSITFIILVFLVFSVDLVRISRPFLSKAAIPHNFFTRQENAEQSIGKYLQEHDRSIYRVHHLFEDPKLYIPGIELTYIFDDMINKNYNDLLEVLQNDFYYLQQPNLPPEQGSLLSGRLINCMNVMNVKFILALSPLKIEGIREIVSGGGLRIYQNDRCFPRHYLANNLIRAVDTKEKIIELATTGIINRSDVVVDEKTAENLKITRDTTATTSLDTVIVDEYKPYQGYTKLRVTSGQEQILVVSENYGTGWTATIEGKPATIFPVNHFARGVVVGKGASVVTFIYDVPSVRFWRKVTLYSAIAFVLFTLVMTALYVVHGGKKTV